MLDEPRSNGMTRAALSLVLASAAAFAQDPPVVFKSDVALVRVDAQVVDSGNRAITGLTAQDFVLYDGSKRQDIRNFSTEDMPVDVLLLLDVSSSMRPHVQEVARAAHQAFTVLGRDDRVGIMVFDRASRLRQPFRDPQTSARELDRLIDYEDFNGGTDITRGLLDAARYIERNGRREGRRAIVILTDDQTEFNRDEASVGRALERADAVLSALLVREGYNYGRSPRGGGRYPQGRYPQGGGWPGGLGGIILGGPGGGRYPGGGNGRLQSAGTAEIAQRSGGDSFDVGNSYGLQDTLERIRQRYALHFYAPSDARAGEERQIQVELTDAARRRHPSADVRYRRTYLSPEGGGSTTVAADADRPVVVRDGSTEPAADETQRGGLKRRRGVSEGRNGPMIGTQDGAGSGTSSTEQQGGWRKAGAEDAGAAAPAKAPSTTTTTTPEKKSEDPTEKRGGWRKAKPGEK